MHKIKYLIIIYLLIMVFHPDNNLKADSNTTQLTALSNFSIQNLPAEIDSKKLEIRTILDAHTTFFDVIAIDKPGQIILTSYDFGRFKGILSPATSSMAAIMIDPRFKKIDTVEREKIEDIIMSDSRISKLVQLYEHYLLTDMSSKALFEFHDLLNAIKELAIQKYLKDKRLSEDN